MSSEARSTAAIFDPDRLRIARQLSALKRSQLAKQAGISASAITQFENGASKPSPSTLAQLSLQLGMPIRFFASTGRRLASVPADQTFFRSLRRTTQTSRDRAVAQATLLAELSRLVDQRVRLPEVNVPEDLSLDVDSPVEQAEEISAEVRNRWGLGEGPVPNAVRLLERNGIVVVRIPMLTRDVDAFCWALPDRPVVVLGSDKGVFERSRRDALHELGHLVMHHSDPEAANAQMERQAERFSSSFLFPEMAFREEWPSGSRIDWASLLALKRRWGMSLAALLYRARDLELVTPTTYQSGMKYMSKQGWRVNEPGDRGRVEEPKLLSKALSLMVENGVDLDDVFEAAGLPGTDQMLDSLEIELDPKSRPLVAV